MSIREKPLNGFCIRDWGSLLSSLSKLGYTFAGIDEIVADRKTAFLRHDVDLCLSRATKMALMEAELGVCATYYVLVSTSMYNVASAQSRELMRKILLAGHEIGLHFDSSLYAGDIAVLETKAACECSILENLIDQPIKSLSFHRPAPSLIGLPGRFAGRRHTYEPEIFNQIGYISDSSGGWYRGHPLDHPSVIAGAAIQLLTHPLWWTNETAVSPSEILKQIKLERAAEIGKGLAAATARAPVSFPNR